MKDKISTGMIKIGDLVDVLSGYAFDSSLFNDKEGFPLIRIRDIKKGATKTYYSGEYDEKFVINKGDILIGMDGEFNISPWSSAPALLNQRVCRISSKDETIALTKYLLYFLPIKLKAIEDSASFVTVKHLSVKDIREIPILLPSVLVQEQIIEILDKADTLRKKDKQLLQSYDALAQSLFVDMFGDPVRNEKKWEIKKLGEYFKNGVKCGPFGSALKRHEFIKEGVPVWNMDNIVNYSFDPNASLFITEQKFKDLSSYRVINGDIIISRAGTVGKMCVVKSENHQSIISTNLIRLSLDDSKILPMYFVLLMKHFSSKIAKLKTAGEGAFTHMNTGVLTGLLLPVPPIALQNQFAQHIRNIEQQKEKLKIQMQESENLFHGLLQKAFNGGLN
jgi:type I restriction enzyme S subunit